MNVACNYEAPVQMLTTGKKNKTKTKKPQGKTLATPLSADRFRVDYNPRLPEPFL